MGRKEKSLRGERARLDCRATFPKLCFVSADKPPLIDHNKWCLK